MIISMTPEECGCSLKDFYRNVAKHLGIMTDRNTIYNTYRIHITSLVEDTIRAYYLREGFSLKETNDILHIQGPMVNLEGYTYRVAVEPGFVLGGE